MMKNKYVFTAVLLAAILAVGAALAGFSVKRQQPEQPEAELSVAASFYPVYIAAENVIGGCEGVHLSLIGESLSGCPHDYQLTTQDMKLLSAADVFLINGGGMEPFLEDVAEQFPELTVIDLCEDLELSGENAHVWMSMEKYISQVDTLARGLAAADAGRADQYRANADAYAARIRKLMAQAEDLKADLAGVPVVIFHEAYEYLAEDYGFTVAGQLDLDEERQVSAGETAQILSVIRERNVPVILAEELYGKDMGERMRAETGVKVLYLDTLVRGDGSADSYLSGMEQNIRLLRETFGGSEDAEGH